MPPLRVTTAIAKFLERAGTEIFFGYVGHGNWAILDSLANRTGMRGIRARCEDHAVHMADCYWRARRGPPLPVVSVTGGPGAMNIPGALAEAFYSNSAMVVLVGAGPSQWFDRGGIQESYRYGPEEWIQVVKPLCKKALLVHRPDTALEMVVRACKEAVTGRPGPVVVQIPFDVQNTEIEVREVPGPAGWMDFHRPAPDPAGVARAADLLLRAERPLLHVSTGIANAGAWDALRALAEAAGIPVTTTFVGKGAFPEDHPLYVGVPGRFGDEHSCQAAAACDVLLAAGVRFTDLTTAAWSLYEIPSRTRLIHVDIDPGEIGRTYPAEVGIVADARLALEALAEALRAWGCAPRRTRAWLAEIEGWRAAWREKVRPLREADTAPIHYGRLYHEAWQAVREVDPETTVLFDTGQTLCYAPSFFRASSRHIHTNNGHFIRRGWSVPGLIGARLANPGHPAIAFVGDGSFMMTGTAVATAVEYGLPAVWVVLNNRSLQFERRMEKIYGTETFCDYKIERTGEPWNPDFVRFAEALGARGLKVREPQRLRAVLREALRADGPVVVDCDIDVTAEVYNPIPFAYTADFHARGLPKPPF